MDLVDDIDVIWNSWKRLFLEAVDRNIPSKSISSKRHVPWLNSSLRKLLVYIVYIPKQLYTKTVRYCNQRRIILTLVFLSTITIFARELLGG